MSSAQDLPPGEGPATADPARPAEPAAESAEPSGATEVVADPVEHVKPVEHVEIHAQLAALTAAVEREHQRAAHRESIIDRLHEDNQALRRSELQALFDPVRAALYRLHDLTRRETERWAADPPDPAHAATLLAAVTDEVAEALARTGIERFTVKPGEPFDPVRHRPVATEPVIDPALDGAVVRVRTDGFEQGDRVVRKAEVCVGRPAPSSNGATPAPPSIPDAPRATGE